MKTLKNSIRNLFFITLLCFSFNLTGQIYQQGNFGEGIFNQPVNNNSNSLQPYLNVEAATCSSNPNYCNQGNHLSAISKGEIMFANRGLFYVSITGQLCNLKFLNAQVRDSQNRLFPVSLMAPNTHNAINSAGWILIFDNQLLMERGFQLDENKRPNVEVLLEGVTANGQIIKTTQQFAVGG